MERRRLTQRLHPALSDVLSRLEGTGIGRAFTDRAVEVSTLTAFGDPIDHAAGLAVHRWVLERADGDGLPLTASGYLKPVDVRALAAMMPTMRDWPFSMAREIDVRPVLDFREYLKAIGLLRKYKASLRLTKAGRTGLADPDALWRQLADTLVLSGSDFDVHASIVVLVHMATTDERIDVDAVAKTMTALGWSHSDGTAVDGIEVYPVWNDLWTALGNSGDSAAAHFSHRKLGPSARVLIHDALFHEIEGEPIS